MSDLPVKRNDGGFEEPHPAELIIDAIDVDALREARLRKAAKLRRLWSERRFLVKLGLWGLVISTAIAFLIPKQYTSFARLMPPEGSGGGGLASMLAALGGSKSGGLATMAESMLGIKTTGELFLGILGSATVQDDLIHKFDLQKRWQVTYLVDARKMLAGHTSIDQDRKNGIITIKVTSRDPQLAQAMAQEYVNRLNWVVNHLSTSSADNEANFLQARLQQEKNQMEADEKAFSEFASKHTAINIPEQGRAMLTSASLVQAQLIAAQTQLEGLRQFYTDNNARVRAAEAQVNELKQQLAKMGGKAEGEAAGSNELYPSIRELPVLGVTWADLYRNVQVDETVFEYLTEQYEAAKVQAAKEVPTVMLLDTPQVPRKKSWPPHILLGLLGAILFESAGIAWVLLRFRWETADRSDPRVALAADVYKDMRAGLPWATTNGHASGRMSRVLGRFGRRKSAGREEEAASQPESIGKQGDSHG